MHYYYNKKYIYLINKFRWEENGATHKIIKIMLHVQMIVIVQLRGNVWEDAVFEFLFFKYIKYIKYTPAFFFIFI